MNEFNKWWNEDLLTEDNPFVDSTPAYWAWEGWRAGVKAEREACAKVCEGRIGGAVQTNDWWLGFRSAMKQCAAAIRARGNT